MEPGACQPARAVTFHLSCQLLRDKSKCRLCNVPFPTQIPLLLSLGENSLFYLDPRGHPGKLSQRHTWAVLY